MESFYIIPLEVICPNSENMTVFSNYNKVFNIPDEIFSNFTDLE